MRQLILVMILAVTVCTIGNPAGLAAGNQGMSPAEVGKKLQEVNAKPPAEISALIPDGTTKTNLVFGPDYGTFSYVRVEFRSEVLNPDYHLHDRAELTLNCNTVDPNSQMAKMMYISAYQGEQEQKIAELRATMKAESTPLMKWEEISTPYGKVFAQTEKYVEGGLLGKNEKPREEYYYHCTYIGRVGGAFFEFRITCLPLNAKSKTTPWFNDLVAKLGKLNVAKLCNY